MPLHAIILQRKRFGAIFDLPHHTRSTTGESLHDVNLTGRGGRITQSVTVLNGLTVDKNHHVLPQAGLVVENLTPQARVFVEHSLDRFTNRPG
jgi:hypothetical protein